MNAPTFWQSGGVIPTLLAPISSLYGVLSARRRRAAKPWRAPVPVVCVGNLVAGGAGKTPVAIAIANRLTARGRRPHLLSRGHGGRERGPLQVEPGRHDALAVGDEPLLLAAAAPTWIARDRAAGARAAVESGAGAIVLDDGFQNPSVAKDLSFLVIDGGYGFGNGRLIPAGPLREPVAEGLARADAVVLLGEDRVGISAELPAATPVLSAALKPDEGAAVLRYRPVVAFAGIGRPEKFFATLDSLSCELLGRHSFADHHRYHDHEILVLADKATKLGALLVTTAKDHARLPDHLRALVTVVDVAVTWQDEDRLDSMLDATFDPKT